MNSAVGAPAVAGHFTYSSIQRLKVSRKTSFAVTFIGEQSLIRLVAAAVLSQEDNLSAIVTANYADENCGDNWPMC